jgi:hypothetical protein
VSVRDFYWNPKKKEHTKMVGVATATTTRRTTPTIITRSSPTSSFVMSFGSRAKTIGICMDSPHITESFVTKSNNSNSNNNTNKNMKGGEHNNATTSDVQSYQRAFLSALVRNNLDQIQILIKGGIDPNFAIHIGLMGGAEGGTRTTTGQSPELNGRFHHHPSGRTTDDTKVWTEHHQQQQQCLPMRAQCLDHVFLFKRILGDCPSPLHLAILNIYFRTKHPSSRYLLRQNRDELDRAITIFTLLIENGAKIQQPSLQPTTRMYSCNADHIHTGAPGTDMGVITPLTLAEKIYRMACLIDPSIQRKAVVPTGSKGLIVTDLRTTMRGIINQCIEYETRNLIHHHHPQQELELSSNEVDQTRGELDIQDEEDIRHDDKSSCTASTGQYRDDHDEDEDHDHDTDNRYGDKESIVVQLEELADLIFVKGQSSSSTPTMTTFTNQYMKSPQQQQQPQHQHNALTFFCSDAIY